MPPRSNLINLQSRFLKWLDWLDSQTDSRFLLLLYVARGILVIPCGPVQKLLYLLIYGDRQIDIQFPRGAFYGFILLVILAPLFETLVECTLPYLILSRKKHLTSRPWTFIIISALIMVVLHPLFAILGAFVTGVFLAYCYAHFAIRRHWTAIGFTSLFHGCINIVGWVFIYILHLELSFS